MLTSSMLLGLALLTPDASAAEIGNVRMQQVESDTPELQARIVVIVKHDDNDVVASVDADLAGVQVPLTETDAWQHGGARLPVDPSALTGTGWVVTTYGADGVLTGRWDGTYADGAIAFGRGASGGCDARVCDEGTSAAADLEILGAHIYDDGAGGIDVGLDFAGPDLYDVAYATVAVTETVTTDELVCVLASRVDGCLEWDYATTTVTTEAEVDWAEVGAVWESEPFARYSNWDQPLEVPFGGYDIRVYDADEKTLDRARLELGLPWDDGGAGIGAVVVDDDSVTSAALVASSWQAVDATPQEESDGRQAFALVSAGWTLGDTLPALAETEWENGETWEIPANSYQVTATVPVAFEGDPEAEAFRVVVDGVALVDGTALGDRGLCAEGTCVALGQDAEGGWALAVTAYADDPDALPTALRVALVPAYGAALPTADAWDVAFDDAVAVVFALESTFAGDPAGLDLVGDVTLRSAANAKGKRSTLARGSVGAQIGTDADGDLGLSAIDPDNGTVSRGDILIGGEPIGIERAVGDEPVPVAPPVVVMKPFEGGKGNNWRNFGAGDQTQQAQLL